MLTRKRKWEYRQTGDYMMGAFWTFCALLSRVFPTLALNYLILLALQSVNSRQYDARTQPSRRRRG